MEVDRSCRRCQIRRPWRRGPFSEMYVHFASVPFSPCTSLLGHRSTPADLRRPCEEKYPPSIRHGRWPTVLTMDEVIGNSVSQPRLRTILMGSFAALAVFLAVIGIFGVVALSVSQRTAEIAIRMALGARGGVSSGRFVRQSFTTIGIGLFIASPAPSRYRESFPACSSRSRPKTPERSRQS